MEPTFLRFAHALRDEAAAAHLSIARLAGQDIAGAIATGELHRRADDVAEAAKLFEALSPHEPLVRAWIELGTLVDFPTFTRNLADLRSGDIVLVKARLETVFAHACRARLAFRDGSLSTSLDVARGEIEAVQRAVPSMWQGTLAR